MNALATVALRLRRLDAAESGAAPYDFAEFRRRCGLAAAKPQPVSSVRGAALAAALTGVLLGAVLWQQVTPAPRAEPAGANYTDPLAMQARDAQARDAQAGASPALVRAGSLAARGELEDHIAFFDAVLSESRVSGTRPERLAALEWGRSQLVESLQRVHYAEQLMVP